MSESKPFEDFLEEQFAKEYHGTDDDMPDAFNNWLVLLEGDDFINYGNEAVRLAEERGYVNHEHTVPKELVDKAIAEEILIAHKEGTSTSRLTSLQQRLQELMKKE